MLPVSAKDLVRFIPPAYDIAGAEQARATAAAELEAAKGAPDNDPDELKKLEAAAVAFDRVVDAVRDAAAALGGPPPVYILAVPTVFTRAAFRRDLALAGVFAWPTDAEIIAVLRAMVTESGLENAPAYVEVLDRVEAAYDSGKPAGDEDMVVVAELERAAGGIPAYRQIRAARSLYDNLAPPIACRHYLKDVENVDVAFRLSKQGMVPDDMLEVLAAARGERELRQVGFRAMTLTRVDAAQRKNFASPSGSRSTPPTSPADQSPQTAAPGSSMANGSAAIHG